MQNRDLPSRERKRESENEIKRETERSALVECLDAQKRRLLATFAAIRAANSGGKLGAKTRPETSWAIAAPFPSLLARSTFLMQFFIAFLPFLFLPPFPPSPLFHPSFVSPKKRPRATTCKSACPLNQESIPIGGPWKEKALLPKLRASCGGRVANR